MTKTMTKTKTQTKCLKYPTYAIFLKSWWLTHSKYDDRYLTLVILFTPVTLITLFRLYNQFYRADCITVLVFFTMKSGFFSNVPNIHLGIYKNNQVCLSQYHHVWMGFGHIWQKVLSAFDQNKNGGKNLKCAQKKSAARAVCALSRPTLGLLGSLDHFVCGRRRSYSCICLSIFTSWWIGGLENRWKDIFRCLQPIPQLLVLVCYVCLLGSLDHLVCGACVQSQISHSAQSGADPRADHNQRETSCWRGKQRNDRLVILRTWSWSRRDSERQALSCWDFCLGETCDSEVFGCSYGFIRWRPAYALGGAQMTISDSGNCYFSTKAFKVVHTTMRRSG